MTLYDSTSSDPTLIWMTPGTASMLTASEDVFLPGDPDVGSLGEKWPKILSF